MMTLTEWYEENKDITFRLGVSNEIARPFRISEDGSKVDFFHLKEDGRVFWFPADNVKQLERFKPITDKEVRLRINRAMPNYKKMISKSFGLNVEVME